MPILSKDLFRKPKNALESLGQRFNLTPAAAPAANSASYRRQ